MRKTITTTIFCSLAVFGLWAQDFEFSQPGLNSLVNHPAAAGFQDAQSALVLAYRSQWAEQDASRNMLASYTHAFGGFRIGARLHQQDAGQGSMTRSGLRLDMAYQRPFAREGDMITVGFSAGLIQSRFDPLELQFDNQYVFGQGYDAGISNEELFMSTNQIRPVLHAGIGGKKYFDAFRLSFSLALKNINKPITSAYEDSGFQYTMSPSFWASVLVPMNDKLQVDLIFLVNKQNIFTEQLAGARFEYELKKERTLVLGAYNRFNNAFILEAGLEVKNIFVNGSFDFNQALRPVITDFRGMFELSAGFTISP